MRQRTKTNIYIKRPTGTYTGGIMEEVPITPNCRRKFTLMQEDSITLVFSLERAINFQVGDFIQDELFNDWRYVLTQEQMPKYNTATGGYDYTLRFDAEYMYWKNFLFTMVAYDGTSDNRMEASWGLTDNLEHHATQIPANLAALDLHGWDISIHDSAAKRNEIKYISYQGCSILEALNLMANAYECEWWVTKENVGTNNERGVINFGKCESDNEPIEFALGDNVESMDIANNRNTYANRIFAYGGSRNIPDDYDKSLIFHVSDVTQDNPPRFRDASRKVTLDMIEGMSASSAIHFDMYHKVEQPSSIKWNSFTKYSCSSTGAKIQGHISVSINFNLATGWTATLIVSVGATTILTNRYSGGNSYSATWDIDIDHTVSIVNNAEVYVTISYTLPEGGTVSYHSDYPESSLIFTSLGNATHATLQIVGQTQSYPITFNPTAEMDNSEDATYFTFDNGTPIDFGVGTMYTLTGLDIFKVPLSFYSPNYNVGVLSKLGAKCLHLPLSRYPNRYIDKGTIPQPNRQAVEMAVQFPEVYPKLELVITEVSSSDIVDETVYSDGSVERRNEKQYRFKVKQKNNQAFIFNTKYLLDGEKLNGVFTVPEQLVNSGFQLAGMTFELGFNNSTQRYTIIRNDTYGALLPNKYLAPSVGDTLFLTGWNPRAIETLGLVSAAESELADKANEYLQAIEEGQFTFTCRMMSDWPFTYIDDIPMHTSSDEPIEEAGGAWFYVQNGFTAYRLPTEGARVAIQHDALKHNISSDKGEKASRIIGYELKLDMPWDSPVYTVGETPAYSRLAQIEKEITKIS